MMKAGIIYTAVAPAAVKVINAEIQKNFDDDIEIETYQDSTILDEVREKGYVTPSAAAKLVSLFMQAVSDGADAMLCCCSSVGELVDASQSLAHFIGVPIVRIDEEMCREAVRLGKRIGILATLPTTMEPTRNTVLRVAKEMDRQIITVDGLMEGTFGADEEEFKKIICEKVAKIINQVDVVLLAQASMSYTEELLAEKFHKPVLSSPRFGVAALAKALKVKNLYGII